MFNKLKEKQEIQQQQQQQQHQHQQQEQIQEHEAVDIHIQEEPVYIGELVKTQAHIGKKKRSYPQHHHAFVKIRGKKNKKYTYR